MAFYAKDGKLHCDSYMEIYIPSFYFTEKMAVNQGVSVQCFGLVYARFFKNGVAQKMQMLNLPVTVDFMLYEFRTETITIHNKKLDVMTLCYLKDANVMHQTLEEGREVGETFLSMVLGGKLPTTLNYAQTLDIWWRNLEIANVSFKVPSKMYEMILATIYRNPHNKKERYGQLYGKQTNPTGMDYETGAVREVVRDLSTFSGMVYEDIGTMITSGINNSLEEVEEPVSPFEKIIHY